MPLSNEERQHLLGIYAARVDGMVGGTDDYPLRWRSLCRRLLAHGGELVVPASNPEPHLDDLLAAASAFARPVRDAVGETSACHANVARLWIDGEVAQIGTGYALSDDGLWRQHSWGLDSDGTLVETTFRRTSYVGIALAEAASLEFAMGNDADHFKTTIRARHPRGVQLIEMVRRAGAARHRRE